ncbi:hypothetical protein [Flocculibacter collagenilyticus]|uniref:hypothetical protein n=1 Tax=Flocculibacter collagenilyticus TaxID=2744479 RepID=UPI0018F3DC10|nr:hypothetical protein [Flocculibacter collagenilyticus]
MPVLTIRSLPLAQPVKIDNLLTKLSNMLSVQTQLNEAHFAIYWITIEKGHFCHSGKTATTQPNDSHPIWIEIYLPDCHKPNVKDIIAKNTTEMLSKSLMVNADNIFISLRHARSGEVFEKSHWLHW